MPVWWLADGRQVAFRMQHADDLKYVVLRTALGVLHIATISNASSCFYCCWCLANSQIQWRFHQRCENWLVRPRSLFAWRGAARRGAYFVLEPYLYHCTASVGHCPPESRIPVQFQFTGHFNFGPASSLVVFLNSTSIWGEALVLNPVSGRVSESTVDRGKHLGNAPESR